jgi:cytokinesis protein
MDSLLEKLRAAAPQARDQRDRRRRARLRERHQIRVASGQRMPDIPAAEGTEGETNDGNDSTNNIASNDDTDAAETELLSLPILGSDSGATSKDSTQISESEDVADRAASMLQGLRDNADGERSRRRRESAEEERRKRRLRRRNGPTGGSKDSADGSVLSLPEPTTPSRADSRGPEESTATSSLAEEDAASQRPVTPMTPVIIVSPTAEQHYRSPSDNGPNDGSPGKYSEPSD